MEFEVSGVLHTEGTRIRRSKDGSKKTTKVDIMTAKLVECVPSGSDEHPTTINLKSIGGYLDYSDGDILNLTASKAQTKLTDAVGGEKHTCVKCKTRSRRCKQNAAGEWVCAECE